MNKPLILLTNDDGISARGLFSLQREIRSLGEVVIVAPDSERSAVGHAITLTEPLRADKIAKNGNFYGYAVNGTPADCVKLAVKALLPRLPDLVISGINLGPNTGVNVIYSGTVSAATEAAIMELPAMAVSLGTFIDPDFVPAARFARRLARQLLKRTLPPRTILNVNVPAGKVRGVKITTQGTAKYKEELEERKDPRGRSYYWLGGKFELAREREDCDSTALRAGYISITPLHYDMTAYSFLPRLKEWGLKIRG